MNRMASSSEQQIQIQAFPDYAKRKLGSNEDSLSSVYKNGVFCPRSEKRQRLNGDYKEFQASLDQNSVSVISNADIISEDQQLTGFPTSRCVRNMEADTEMMEETASSTAMEEISGSTMNGDANSNVYPIEPTTENTKQTNGVYHVNLPRTKTVDCTTSVHSYCFQGGLLDNMLVNYHGL